MTTRATAARRFLAELDRAGVGDVEPDQLGPEHLDCFEEAIDGTLSESSAWKIVTLVCGLLRSAVEAGLLRPSDALEQRLRYNTLRFEYRIHPLDAYPATVVDQIRSAAWKDLLAARHRRQRGEAMLAGDDHGSPTLAALVRAIDARGGYLRYDETIGLHLRGAWDNTGDANRLLHLTTDEVVAGLVLLGLKTGIEPESLAELDRHCVPELPDAGHVQLAYIKRRAHGAPRRVARIADGAMTTPGGLLRLVAQLTEHTSLALASDRLWLCVGPRGLCTPDTGTLDAALKRFARRHRITGPDGSVLESIDRRRLRKSFKRDRYLTLNGVLPDFADGHSVEIAARHYADLPSLRHLHEATVADALTDALAVTHPRVAATADLQDLAAHQGATLAALGREATERIVSGDADVFVAACVDITHSPFGPPGQLCPTPFTGCFSCPNAVFTARRLAAVIAYQRHCETERDRWPPAEWQRRYGAAHQAIVNDILPAMTAEEITAATAKADSEYIPAEARR